MGMGVLSVPDSRPLTQGLEQHGRSIVQRQATNSTTPAPIIARYVLSHADQLS